MEEAEALCTKMGIMVNGEFKCFGSSQHIKDKYGTGYELEIKIRTLNEDEVNAEMEKISGFMPLNFDHVK
jgi:ABC-type multidrug transport system ATPase subunit